MNEEMTGHPTFEDVPPADEVRTDSDCGPEINGNPTEEEPHQDVYEDLSEVGDMELLTKMAAAGNVSAMFQLGYNYHEGQFVEQDYKKALSWYRKAAAYGHPVAQYNISLLYANGYGVKADKRKAFYYAQSAAWGEYPLGQVNTGYYYLNGEGVRQNIKNALIWSAEAALSGEETAEENVGIIRENFRLTEDGDLDKKAYRRGPLAVFFIVVGILLSGWMALECLRSFSQGSFLSGVEAGILLPVNLLILSGAVLAFMRKKSSIYLLGAAFFLYLVSLAAGSSQWYVIAFALPVVLAVLMPGKDGASIYATTIQNSEIGRFFEEVGYGPDYEPGSSKTRLYKILSLAGVAVLAVVSFMVVIPMFRQWEGFSLNPNVFKSPLLPFLMVIGFFMGLKEKTSSYKTYDVYENKLTGEKRYEESGDIIDSMTGGILMPLAQRFILIPLGMAIGVYYVLWVVVWLTSGILPYLILLLTVGLLAGLGRLYLRNSFKKNRLAVMGIITLVVACMVWELWLR